MSVTEALSLPPLACANGALGDPAVLAALWDEHGYWFFRNVLDKAAVGRMRRAFLDVLVEMGFVDPGLDEPVWNGKSLKDFPEKIEVLHEKRVWQRFVAEPTIVSFFVSVLGGPLFWVPIVEYRITPPAPAPWPDPYVGRHQDMFANEGIAFRTCWVPLADIDAQAGGLAMAEGLAGSAVLHDANDSPRFPIPPGAIPDEVWRRSDYGPGDLVMFSPRIPHAGLANYSNRFRLSLDIRVMRASDRIPVVGEVRAVQQGAITIRNHAGRDVRLVLDEATYCRGVTGARIPTAKMVQDLAPGALVIASEDAGHAKLLRPQR